jgi:hypothetical protein
MVNIFVVIAPQKARRKHDHMLACEGFEYAEAVFLNILASSGHPTNQKLSACVIYSPRSDD